MIYSMHWEGNPVEYNVSLNYASESFKRNHPEGTLYHPFIALAGKKLNLRNELAKFIKESVDDSFVFILTKKNGRYDDFCEWLDEENLGELIVSHPDAGFTNPNYHSVYTYGKDTVGNLRLVVLASKNHSLRSEFKASKPELIKKFNSIES